MDPAFLQQLEARMAERLQEVKAARNPETFSFFLREGRGYELEFQRWVYEEVCRRSSLPEGWSDHKTELEFRSHPVLWEVVKEFMYSVNREGRELLVPVENRQRPRPRIDQEGRDPEEPINYTFRIEENIPLALKPYTRLLDFHLWGETLYFDYGLMKAEALDIFMASGNLEQLQNRYREIEELERKYPNKYAKDYDACCIRISENRPHEIGDAENARIQHRMDLMSSNEGRAVMRAIEEFNQSFPEPTPTTERTSEYRELLGQWGERVTQWYNAIQPDELRELVDYRPNRPIYLRFPF